LFKSEYSFKHHNEGLTLCHFQKWIQFLIIDLLKDYCGLVVKITSLKTETLKSWTQTSACPKHGGWNICCFWQPGIKGCLEVQVFEPQPSDSQPVALTTQPQWPLLTTNPLDTYTIFYNWLGPTGLVMGPEQKIFTQVRSDQFFCFSGRSAIFGLGLGLENFP